MLRPILRSAALIALLLGSSQTALAQNAGLPAGVCTPLEMGVSFCPQTTGWRSLKPGPFKLFGEFTGPDGEWISFFGLRLNGATAMSDAMIAQQSMTGISNIYNQPQERVLLLGAAPITISGWSGTALITKNSAAPDYQTDYFATIPTRSGLLYFHIYVLDDLDVPQMLERAKAVAALVQINPRGLN